MKEDESGTVSIMFNYNTEDEKTWFDGIEKLALVSYDEQKRTLNADLQFDMKKNVLHGKGMSVSWRFRWDRRIFGTMVAIMYA